MTLSHLKPQLPSNLAETLMGKGCLITTSFWTIRAQDYGVIKNCMRYGSFFCDLRRSLRPTFRLLRQFTMRIQSNMYEPGLRRFGTTVHEPHFQQ